MLSAILTIILIVGGTALLAWPLGKYMAGLFSGRFARTDGLFARTVGGAPEQDWKQYSCALIAFNIVMFGFVFTLLATQHMLPLNPDGQRAATLDLVFNTAASFTTNTNLQHYSGESTWSYLAQIGGLMWLQFVSAATGIAALAALARGIGGKPTMGNFFVDLQRAAFFVLLPLAIIIAAVIALNGVPMTLQGARAGSRLCGEQAARDQWRGLLRPQLDPSAGEPHLLVERVRNGRDHPDPDGLCMDVRSDHRPTQACHRRVRRDGGAVAARHGAQQRLKVGPVRAVGEGELRGEGRVLEGRARLLRLRRAGRRRGPPRLPYPSS